VAWRPALPTSSSSQAYFFRVAKARPLAIKVDDIVRRGIAAAFALLLLELLPKGKAIFLFLEFFMIVQQWLNVKALLS
jgi:hypothetical protein